MKYLFHFFVLLSFLQAKATVLPVDHLQERIANERSALTDGDEKQRELMSTIFQINTRLKGLVNERSRAEQESMLLEANTKELAEKIVELEKKVSEQRTLLQHRLGALYKFGGQGVAKLVFSSTSSATLERNLKILGLITKHDLDLVQSYNQHTKEFETKQKKFLARLQSLKKAQAKVTEQEKKISGEAQAKFSLLNSIRKNKSKHLTQLRTLRGQLAKKMTLEPDEFVELLLTPSFAEMKGQVEPPVVAPLIQKYGLWRDPVFNVTLSRKGIVYKTTSLTPVRAVYQGLVSFSGQIPGLGQTVIVDHGDHYYSVYSGDFDVTPKEGTSIDTGQKLASINKNLYFEIRHFSEPHDPLAWMKGLPHD